MFQNKTLSLCITCYDGDYHLLNNLLEECKKQTMAPDELIISSSGVKENLLLDIDGIEINGKNIPVVTTNSLDRNDKRSF